MEVNSWLIQNKKTGAQRSKKGMAGLIILYIFLFGSLGVVFFGVGMTLCQPLSAIGLDWFYFSMMGIISIMLGVFGSVFNTYATLYKAKDNELLLSLPIKPLAILFVRLSGVWMWSLIYEAIVFIPTLLVYWLKVNHGFLTIVSGLLLLIAISFFVLTLACILGWVVAKISERMKNKSFVTVLVSLVFLGVYYYICFQAQNVLQVILKNASEISEKVKGAVYPLYIMGKMGTGDLLSGLLFILGVAVLFALVFLVLSKSFIKLATANRGDRKKEYKGEKTRLRKPENALLFKEFKRFVSSSTYMLNCGLGTLLMPITAIAALIKGKDLLNSISILDQEGLDITAFLPLIVCAIVCMFASMNDITAPSVSLEGKSLWLVQTLPIKSEAVLSAKLKLHLIITEIPVIFSAVCLCIALKIDIVMSVIINVVAILFVLLSAAFGLTVNLKSPNLTWTDETVPVKQSFGVLLSMLGLWVFILLLAGLYFLLRNIFTPMVYLILCAAIVGGTAAGLLAWIKVRGAKIFAAL